MCVSWFVLVYLKGLKATFYVLILVYINYTLGVFEGHFELFSVSSGAFVNFIQWQSFFLAILWLSIRMLQKLHFCGFAPTLHQLNIINGVCFEYFQQRSLWKPGD